MERRRPVREYLAVAVTLVLGACTAAPPAASPTPTAVPTPSPVPTTTPSESPAPIPPFEAARAHAFVRELAALGPRETTSATYRRASALVAERFRALGYAVEFQRFDVPAGNVDEIQVASGSTRNVVARPAGSDPRAPHLVIGGHLDTVPDSPGANDNGSGIGTLLEIARLATLRPPPMPVVFVAFAAEERRRQSEDRSTLFLGALEYLDRMSPAERDSLRGMINLDMIGNGEEVLVLGGRGPISAALLAAAERRGVPARPSTVADRFSDHQAFREAGYPVGWLWAGDHPSLHRPDDTIAVIQRPMLRRAGTVAWEALRRLRLE